MRYLIKGGEFNNKGAEAMTLIAITRIIQSDHSPEIYMVDYGTNKPYELCCDVHFIQIPYFEMNRIFKRGSIKDLLKKLIDLCYLIIPWKQSSFFKTRQALSIVRSIDYMIDISGYQLGSSWGEPTAINYCDWINLITKYGGKVVLMPQSFGTFQFSKITIDYIKNTLKKCEIIYARETKGYNDLITMGLNNVRKSPDSVLLEGGFNASAVIKNYDSFFEKIEVEGKTNICIVPNYRLIDIGGYSYNKLLDFYSNVIRRYKDADFYLVAHAGEDIEMCKSIKNQFQDDERVHFIDHVLLSFNYEELVKHMDFIIASRYHSIIHAYKEYTPAIILGWADKYEEVAKIFYQDKYIIDLKNISDDLLTTDLMFNQCKKEREILNENVPIIQKMDCYSFLTGTD